MRVCRLCKQEKPITEFGKSNRHTDGWTTHCLQCNRAMKKPKMEKIVENARARIASDAAKPRDGKAEPQKNLNYWKDYVESRDNNRGYVRETGNKLIKSRGV